MLLRRLPATDRPRHHQPHWRCLPALPLLPLLRLSWLAALPCPSVAAGAAAAGGGGGGGGGAALPLRLLHPRQAGWHGRQQSSCCRHPQTHCKVTGVSRHCRPPKPRRRLLCLCRRRRCRAGSSCPQGAPCREPGGRRMAQQQEDCNSTAAEQLGADVLAMDRRQSCSVESDHYAAHESSSKGTCLKLHLR